MTEYVRNNLRQFIGCKFRYRFVDWSFDSWTPWYDLTEIRCEQMINDNSIEKIQIEL